MWFKLCFLIALITFTASARRFHPKRSKDNKCKKLLIIPVSCESVYLGNHAQCTFTLTNKADIDLKVKKWMTLIRVQRIGSSHHRLDYLRTPWLNFGEGLEIRSNESVNATFNMTRSSIFFRLRPGKYKMAVLVHNRLTYLPSSGNEKNSQKPRKCLNRESIARQVLLSVSAPPTAAPKSKRCCSFFKPYLSVRPLYSLGGAIRVTYILYNKAQVDYWVLKYLTPLEKFRSATLQVFRGHEKLDYRGYFVRRAMPAPRSQYVRVPAGGIVTHTLNLSEVFRINKKGKYRVLADNYLQDYYPVVEKGGKPKYDKCLCRLATGFARFRMVR